MNLSGMKCKPNEVKMKGLEWNKMNVSVILVSNESR
jgi:hypothetical protein